MRGPFKWVIICSIVCLAATASAVVNGGAIILQFDSSVRNEGMGQTGVANHWGGDPGMWANPALLSYHQGAHYTFFDTQLVPDLADDIRLTDEYLSLGGGGIGLYYAKGPVTGIHLDMGEQLMVNESGEIVGRFESWMKAERVGAGVSVFRFLEALFGAQGPALSRWFDVSAGAVMTEFEDQLGGDDMLDKVGYTASGTSYSYGALARLTPLNTIGRTYASGPLGGVRVDVAYGMSLLNDSEDMIIHMDADQADHFPRMFVQGWSAHAETGVPPVMRSYFEHSNLGWLADSLAPLVSFGYAEQIIQPGLIWNNDISGYEHGHDISGEFDQKSWGWELAIANIWYLRKGHVTDASGDIDGATVGHGLGFRLGNLGGVRWDKATVPQATGLANVERESFTAWVDLSSLLH